MSSSAILKRTGTVGFLTLLSRIAGLARDVAIAHAFGTRMAADAFFVAFRIPNLLRRLFAEGALTVSFVPIFTASLKQSRQEAKRVVDVSTTLMLVLLVGVVFLGILFAPWIVRLTAWGFTRDPTKLALTVTLTRAMFPYLLLVSLAALAMGILNSVKHFAAPAAASIFMNLGVIAGALFLTRWFDPPVMGLAVGVLAGGLMQLSCHFPFLISFGFWPRLAWDPGHPAVRKVLGMMAPAAYGAAVYQFNVILITLLASFLPSGSVSYLWYADRLMEFPLGIFAVSMATVLLPSLADHAAERDMTALKETFRTGLRMIFFITIPAAGGLIVLARPIIHLLFEHGTFTPEATVQTGRALLCFAVGLPFIAGVRITANAFYALQDSKTPVRAANLSVLVNLFLSFLLMGPMAHSGLALAVSLASVCNFLLQIFHFRRRAGLLGLRKVVGGVAKTTCSTLVMMAVLWRISSSVAGGRLQEGGRLFALILLGVAVFVAAEWLLKGKELSEILNLLRREKGIRPPPVPPSWDD